MVEIDDVAPGPPFPAGPGQGVWRKTRSGAFNYTYLNLIYDPSTFASNGKLKIRGLLLFDHDPDHFAGQNEATGYDKDGKVIFTTSAAVTGTRIVNEPF